MQRWQRRHGRHDLPWQRTRDPYRVWLSEVMLQQTQVTTVLPYYERFLQRFPDLRSLAAAELPELLALWSGLGYYSRARHLHRAARIVVDELGGRLPRTAAGLQRLPGIGRSTAAAIAVFCHGERAAILDGNVRRVLARALGFAEDIASTGAQQRLWALAESLLPARGIASYTQGLMDLGAGVCLPRAPRCEACPLAAICVAHIQGRPQAYPVRSRRIRRGQRESVWLWLQAGPEIWLVQRPPQGIWAGLWSLPEFDSIEAAREALSGLPGRPQALPGFVHALTHLDWTLQPLHWPLPPSTRERAERRLRACGPSGRWMTVEQALASGIPAPLRRMLEKARA
ncbi:MAG TPA: A/G-specific adenine glycosylase [Rubrivivax sp.]|nr:A/G-specific adenine glycosylase [Rubrivivax sp.]